jgi:hypothetical protein
LSATDIWENRRMFWKVRAIPAATVSWVRRPFMSSAVEVYLALGGLVDAGEQVEHRGLSGTVGAYEAHKLAGANFHIEVADGLKSAEGYAQMLGF